MNDQSVNRTGRGTTFFSSGPLGPWPEENKYKGELGCAYPLLGFFVFVILAVILWQHFFN